MRWFDCRPDWVFWTILIAVAIASFAIGGLLT